MKKVLWALALAVVAAPAQAGWELVKEIPNGSNYYIDPNIEVEGSRRRLWLLRDPMQLPGLGSIKALYEIDCADERQRTLQIQGFEGAMGRGKTVNGKPPNTEWQRFIPYAVQTEVFRDICAKR